MIVRLLTGRVPAERLERFHEEARLTLESARRSPGMIHGELARQIRADCSEDVVFLTTWRDLASLYAWIGGNDLLRTPLSGHDKQLFESLEVQHYEALDEDDGDLGPDWSAAAPLAEG